ncbi:MAG: hypothetical protein V1866_01770 [archaeon]
MSRDNILMIKRKLQIRALNVEPYLQAEGEIIRVNVKANETCALGGWTGNEWLFSPESASFASLPSEKNSPREGYMALVNSYADATLVLTVNEFTERSRLNPEGFLPGLIRLIELSEAKAARTDSRASGSTRGFSKSYRAKFRGGATVEPCRIGENHQQYMARLGSMKDELGESSFYDMRADLSSHEFKQILHASPNTRRLEDGVGLLYFRMHLVLNTPEYTNIAPVKVRPAYPVRQPVRDALEGRPLYLRSAVKKG